MRMPSGRIGWTGALILAAALTSAGCGSKQGAEGPVVLEIQGFQETLGQLGLEYDRVNGPGTFEKATADQRQQFLETIGQKEVLIRIAREQIGPPKPEAKIALRDANDTHLLKALETKVCALVPRDSTELNDMVAKMNRKVLCDYIVNPSDSLAEIARAELVAGKPIAEIARKYSTATPGLCNDGRLMRAETADAYGRDFGDEMFLQGHGPGYITQIRFTPRGGYEFYRIVEFTPFDMHSVKLAEQVIPQMAEAMLTHRRIVAFTDSLQKAHGLEAIDEGLAVLQPVMLAYWDTLAAQTRRTQHRPTLFEPPLDKLTDAQKAVPLYKLDGKTHTVGEFVTGLRDLMATAWPRSRSHRDFRDQVVGRVMVSLEMDFARKIGIDKRPDYVLEAKRTEEKMLLDDFYANVLSPSVTVPPEEVQAYYDQHKEDYARKPGMRFSYVIFPQRADAIRFYKQAADSGDVWWSSRVVDYENNRKDVHAVANSPEVDPSQPVPEELKGLVERGQNLKVGKRIEPFQVTGGWMVGEVDRNDKPGYIPFEACRVGLTRMLTSRKVDEKVQKLIEDGRTRLKLTLYPDRLGGAKA